MSKVYMGQIMAECDCEHPSCQVREYCMAEKIAQLQQERDAAVAGLKPLVKSCEVMRDGSGYRADRYEHKVTDSQWSAWCKQIKTASAVLTKLEAEK